MNKVEKQKEVLGLHFHNLVAYDDKTQVSLQEVGEQINKKFTVADTLDSESFIEIKRLINTDNIIINILYDDDTSEVVNKEEAFHIAALLLNFNKKKAYLYKEGIRKSEHNNNELVGFTKKVIKRRNKKKLNKKFKK